METSHKASIRVWRRISKKEKACIDYGENDFVMSLPHLYLISVASVASYLTTVGMLLGDSVHCHLWMGVISLDAPKSESDLRMWERKTAFNTKFCK